MSSASAFPPPSPPSSSAGVPMVVITVVGILAAFALLAGYYAFVTRCQPLRALLSRGGPASVNPGASPPAAAEEKRGLGLPLIRMLPVVRFTAAEGAAAPRISVSECAVCLSEFAERERVRLLPGCSHAFHIDCIDTWLQGSARCPFCRRDVTLPAPHHHRPPPPAFLRRDERLATATDDDDGGGSIVIEVRGERERWSDGRSVRKKKAESVGDEAVDTRKKGEFAAVQPMRRSLSMDSCDAKQRQLYVSVVREFLAQS
ncbi:RING-H2 finger protein ATL1-like [Hordeum vulgare subsp. vulgare]|uniref:RING-type E3 ubiquitin transferase n=1 Tax=Hordeum vulgare subsp. vulgare TaxID=112509 RepID=A0A8I6XPW7_HORVV|nr:RING-H2 finger protein ATL1-like [Hordeum vulgare subsp. vulgare]